MQFLIAIQEGGSFLRKWGKKHLHQY
jgi:hypothetical protein